MNWFCYYFMWHDCLFWVRTFSFIFKVTSHHKTFSIDYNILLSCCAQFFFYLIVFFGYWNASVTSLMIFWNVSTSSKHFFMVCIVDFDAWPYEYHCVYNVITTIHLVNVFCLACFTVLSDFIIHSSWERRILLTANKINRKEFRKQILFFQLS